MQVLASVRGLRETLIVRRREANALEADTHLLDAPGHHAQRHVPDVVHDGGRRATCDVRNGSLQRA